MSIAAIRNSHGTDRITYPGGVGTDTYHATKSEWVVLANAYVDLGTWWCITPFIGAGVGGARVAINDFTDTGIANNGGGALPGLAYGDNVVEVEFGLGGRMPVSPTRSRRTSPSNSPIATSIWATA